MENGVFREYIQTLYFVSKTSTRPVGISFPKATWAKLNNLRTGVKRFNLFMLKWGLARHCECSAIEQTVAHALSACPIHWALLVFSYTLTPH